MSSAAVLSFSPRRSSSLVLYRDPGMEALVCTDDYDTHIYVTAIYRPLRKAQ